MCLSCSFVLRVGHRLCRECTRHGGQAGPISQAPLAGDLGALSIPAKHICDAMRIVPEDRNGRGLGLAVRNR